jgi:amino acid adenylation domain-containing protein
MWTDLVTAQALRRPGAVALRSAGQMLTYGELEAQANQLARRLIDLGVGPERRVALLMDRSIAFVVAVLAVGKSGGAYLPVDPTHPARRTAFMLSDANPSVLIINTDLVDASVSAGFEVVDVRAIESSRAVAGWSAAPVTAADRRAPLRPQHAAYLIYTSGSTGTPKGVIVTHAGITNMVSQQIDRFAVRPDSRVLQFASLGSDAAFSEIAMALCSGACLVLAPSSALVPGPELATLVAEHAITHLTITPTALTVMEPADLLSVSTLIVAGEACSPRLVDQWVSGRRLINAYGPTETTVCATMSDPLTGGSAPIGRPLGGTSAYVLDHLLRPLSNGKVGELCVGGVGVARGYLGRRGLTAEKFVADPWGIPGSRMYRTGDLVRANGDGALEFVGRIDGQVKIRGQRVDTGEVEVVLGEHPGVRDVRVVTETDSWGASCLAAYAIPTQGIPTQGQPPGDGPAEIALTGSLRAWARQHLPEFMVPSRITVLDRFPRNLHGKLDPEALLAERNILRTADRAPSGGVTQLLCDLFADTLSLGDAHECADGDDFFDLGGHSLTGVLLLSRVQALFGVRLTLPDLAVAPSPGALAELLTQAHPSRTRGEDLVLPLRSRGERPPLFCLPPATGLGWCYGRLLTRVSPDHPVYALQAPGLAQRDQPIDTMDGLIDHYVRLIRKIQPESPYHLLGWSFGGVLAHAIAVRMQRADERIALLAVLDGYPGRGGTRTVTTPTDSVGCGAPSERETLRLLLESLGCEAKVPDTDELPLEWAARRLAERDTALGMLDIPRMRRMLDVLHTSIRLQREYTPGVFRGQLALFSAEVHDQGAIPDPALWQPHVDGDLHIFPVPVSHHRMLEAESLAVVAPVLAAQLESVPTTRPPDEALTSDAAGVASFDPFDAAHGPCHVLRNDEGQYSLWPAAVEVPSGWHIAFAGQAREQCLAYVEASWTDQLPASLTAANSVAADPTAVRGTR